MSTPIKTNLARMAPDAVDAALSGDLATSMVHGRHIPRPKPTGRRRSFNHVVRASAKRLAQAHDARLCERLGLPCIDQGSSPAADGLAHAPLRPHLENDLRRRWSAARPPPRLRCRRRPHQTLCGGDEDEGRDLAHSEVPLPSDRFRLVRRPTLEREEAFHDASTSSRGKIRLLRSAPETDDAQVAELYRMGLLYDDDQERADVFNLNSIRHDQPVYSIRSARRPPKFSKSGRRDLHLDLSFSDLGDETAIAHYIASPFPIRTTSNRGPQRHDGQSCPSSCPPIRVIYELAGSRPLFDVDTSQPPDLVTDLLSDYDCFSDSDLDDTPSQREVHDGPDNQFSDPWVMLGDGS